MTATNDSAAPVAPYTKIELAVEMTCQSCVNDIKGILTAIQGVREVQVDLAEKQVLVDTNLPSSVIKNALGNTGRSVIVRGQSGSEKDLGAAVCILDTDKHTKGLVRFLQIKESECVIEGTITGLTPGLHGLTIHEYGDISNGCLNCGPHYNPTNVIHGSRSSSITERHVGDLGNVLADENGKAKFRFTDNLVRVNDIIGRSMVIHEKEDDFGLTANPESAINGSSGVGLSCGIIARSAGVFQNHHTFCGCTGKTMWDENETAVNFN